MEIFASATLRSIAAATRKEHSRLRCTNTPGWGSENRSPHLQPGDSRPPAPSSRRGTARSARPADLSSLLHQESEELSPPTVSCWGQLRQELGGGSQAQRRVRALHPAERREAELRPSPSLSSRHWGLDLRSGPKD